MSLRSSLHKVQDFESNMYYPAGMELPLKKANTQSGKHPSSRKSNASSSRHNTHNSRTGINPGSPSGGRGYLKFAPDHLEDDSELLDRPDLVLQKQYMVT